MYQGIHYVRRRSIKTKPNDTIYYRHIGVHLKPIKDGATPKVILMLRCRLGNQLHQVWIAQLIREMLNRPLHVVLHSNAERFNIYESGLVDIPKYDSFENYKLENNPLYKCVQNCTVNPFIKLLEYGEKIHTHDIVINLFGECWTYIGEHEEYIRKLYRVRNELPKQERILIHLRLGDVAHKTTENKKYIHFVIQTIKRIFIQEHRKLPVYILAEDTQHSYTKELETALIYEYNIKVNVFNNENPCDDFRELMASSHIIATNSTFTFWAAFLADPKTTEVYIGLSDTQPIPSRNEPLYMYGCPANFHIANIDVYQEYVPKPPLVKFSNEIGICYEKCIVTIADKIIVNSTINLLKHLVVKEKTFPVVIVCLDKDTYNKIKYYIEYHHKHYDIVLCDKEIEYMSNTFIKLDIIRKMFEYIDKEILLIDITKQSFSDDPETLFDVMSKMKNTDIVVEKDTGSLLVRNTPITRKLLNYHSCCDSRMIQSFGDVGNYMKFMKDGFNVEEI
jgi:hypothetical protein